MDSLEDLTKSQNGKPSFFKHVFNFNEESKSEMSNIVQYAVLALVPIVIMNKLIQNYVPEADDSKGSPEILVEIIGQVVIMFLGILIIHRIITFVPTYSGEKYNDFSVTNIILGFLVIVLSLQTKLGEKVSILTDRVIALWEGPQDTKKKKKGQGNVKVSQPIAQQQSFQQPVMQPNVQFQQQAPQFQQSAQQFQQPQVNQAPQFHSGHNPNLGQSGMNTQQFEPNVVPQVGTGIIVDDGNPPRF